MATPTIRVKVPKKELSKTFTQRALERVAAFLKALLHAGAITFWALILKVCADQIAGHSVGLFRWWFVGTWAVLFVFDEWGKLKEGK
jgi:hypothetical protein